MDRGPAALFAKASEDPATVASRVASATRPDGVIVKDIRQQAARTVGSITSDAAR
jgi:hypothetical protein